MRKGMYSVYDNKAMYYMPPFIAVNDNVAVRMFSQVVNEKNSEVSKSPEDFVLVNLGEYDDSNGAVIAKVPLKILGVASVFMRKEDVKEVR